VPKINVLICNRLSPFVSPGGQGALRLASYYGDHMVLQRGPQSAVVWGHAQKKGDTVTVTVTDAKGSHVTASAKVAHQPHVAGGVWKVCETGRSSLPLPACCLHYSLSRDNVVSP